MDIPIEVILLEEMLKKEREKEETERPRISLEIEIFENQINNEEKPSEEETIIKI